MIDMNLLSGKKISTPPPAPENVSPVLFIFGQSNSLGVETPSQMSAIYQSQFDWTDNPDIQFYDADTDSFSNYSNTLQALNTFGIELPLGTKLAEYYGNPCYVLKRADGGTALHKETAKLDWSPIAPRELADIAKDDYIIQGLAKIRSLTTNTLKIFIEWHQWEQDALAWFETIEDYYYDDLTTLFNLWKAADSALNDATIFIPLAQNPHTAYDGLRETVQAIQSQWATDYGAYTVPIGDLSWQVDGGHLDADGQVQKGLREWQMLVDNNLLGI